MVGVSGTLLGPEGTAGRLLLQRCRSYSNDALCVVRVGVWSLFENCTVDASICGQVFKGARWMPWH
jgi:hypothetical protein